MITPIMWIAIMQFCEADTTGLRFMPITAKQHCIKETVDCILKLKFSPIENEIFLCFKDRMKKWK